MSPTPSPPDTQPSTPSAEVGPFVIHTAATAGLRVEPIPNDSGAAFVAIHGAILDHVATQAVLDQVVYSSNASGYRDLWICDMWGGNNRRITTTTDTDEHPAWSPDGSRIAFERDPPGSTNDNIFVCDPDGANVTQLVSDTASDRHPTWSPDGSRIAFETNRNGNSAIYGMYADGTHEHSLSNDSSNNYYDPDFYCADSQNGALCFVSTAFSGNTQVCSADESNFAGTLTQLTNTTASNYDPAWHPDGSVIAYQGWPSGATADICAISSWGTDRGILASTSSAEIHPSYSTDGNYLVYSSNSSVNYHLYAVDLRDRTLQYRITTAAADNMTPHLGAPTLQTDRVLIGPTGSDRGFDPMGPRAYGAVLVFGEDGYLNFVRIGISRTNAPTMRVDPIEDAGDQLVALAISAPTLNAVHQDNGAGRDPSFWDLAGQQVTAALLLFNAHTGKLVSVLELQDESYTAAADHAALTFRQAGGRTIVEGSFSAVYDRSGSLVAEGEIGTVEVDTQEGMTRAL